MVIINVLFKTDKSGNLALPLCNIAEHKSMFHYIFNELPETHLQALTLDQPYFYLNLLDLVCLGDAIRRTAKLRTLDLQGLKKVRLTYLLL